MRLKLLVAAAITIIAGAVSAQTKDVVVGAGFVLSGPIAAYGEDAKTGVDLAAAQINAEGGVLGQKIRVDYLDTEADRAKAVAIYRKFAADPQVAVMLTISSIEFVALDPVASDVKLPFISVGSAAPMTKFSPWSFRLQLIVNKAMPAVLSEVTKIHQAKNIAVIYDTTNNYNVGEMTAVKEASPGVGLSVKGVETFNTGDQNFLLQLSRLAALNPDILYVAATTNEAALIISQARDIGIKAAIIGGAGLNDPRIAALPGNASDGVMTFFPFDAKSERPAVKKFLAAYKAQYGDKTPAGYVALGYDALHLAADAVRRAGSVERDAVRIALGTTQGMEGANGVFRYSGSGDNLEQKPIIFIYKNGGFERLSH